MGWGSVVGGALSGAGAGASMGGPWGALAGAAVGGLMALQSDKDKSEKLKQYNMSQAAATRYSPWTGMTGKIEMDGSDNYGDALGGAATGAAMYQAGSKLMAENPIKGVDTTPVESSPTPDQKVGFTNLGASDARMGAMVPMPEDGFESSSPMVAQAPQENPTFSSLKKMKPKSAVVSQSPWAIPTSLLPSSEYKGPGYY